MSRYVDEILKELERDGYVEKMRDANGNVVTRPGRGGKQEVVWRRTEKPMPGAPLQ